MNDEIKEILDYIDDRIIPNSKFDKIRNYITNLQEENERLETALNAYKDEFCKDTITKYELVMEREYYKSNCKKAIEFCDYLLDHNEVIINGKTYIKQNGDDIITKVIRNKLGGDN